MKLDFKIKFRHFQKKVLLKNTVGYHSCSLLKNIDLKQKKTQPYFIRLRLLILCFNLLFFYNGISCHGNATHAGQYASINSGTCI